MVYIRPNRFLGEILKYEEQGKEKAQQELFSKKDKTDQDSKFKVDTRAHTDKMDSTNESKSRDKSQGILALENKNASPRKSRLFKICKETFLLRRFGDFVALVSLSFFVAFVSLASLGHGLAAFPFLMGSIFCFPLMDTLNKIVSNKDLQ
ncbi:Plasmodium exported protein, unknown function [Plasmodium ovale wallikeri]|nr:Plasmodium exported protein, unknown function [Plasmodium ovale wallikeri]SBT54036.1 Plasmodium exported protein, unknown function [Plasmodium ovale wallikeri]